MGRRFHTSSSRFLSLLSLAISFASVSSVFWTPLSPIQCGSYHFDKCAEWTYFSVDVTTGVVVDELLREHLRVEADSTEFDIYLGEGCLPDDKANSLKSNVLVRHGVTYIEKEVLDTETYTLAVHNRELNLACNFLLTARIKREISRVADTRTTSTEGLSCSLVQDVSDLPRCSDVQRKKYSPIPEESTMGFKTEGAWFYATVGVSVALVFSAIFSVGIWVRYRRLRFAVDVSYRKYGEISST